MRNAGTHGRLAVWMRPVSVARYILRETDLEVLATDINDPPKPAG